MIRYGMSTKGVLLGALMIAPAACLGPGDITGDDEDARLVGTIVVATMTSGATTDPDGYLASLNEGLAQPIDANGTITFGDVPIGTHNVLLSGFNGTCQPTTPNPVYVVLLPDSTITTQFEVSCP
jgi:hypothetical protein